MIDEILKYNQNFVENKKYLKYATDKYPTKKIAIISCMDTRLVKLLPAALGVKNGDVKIIKNAGGSISHPYGSTMQSLIVSIYTLGVKEILVIGHDDCGMQKLSGDKMIEKMINYGISKDVVDEIITNQCDLKKWLTGFDNVNDYVRENVKKITSHPLIPKDIAVHGLVIDPCTGQLRRI